MLIWNKIGHQEAQLTRYVAKVPWARAAQCCAKSPRHPRQSPHGDKEPSFQSLCSWFLWLIRGVSHALGILRLFLGRGGGIQGLPFHSRDTRRLETMKRRSTVPEILVWESTTVLVGPLLHQKQNGWKISVYGTVNIQEWLVIHCKKSLRLTTEDTQECT